MPFKWDATKGVHDDDSTAFPQPDGITRAQHEDPMFHGPRCRCATCTCDRFATKKKQTTGMEKASSDVRAPAHNDPRRNVRQPNGSFRAQHWREFEGYDGGGIRSTHVQTLGKKAKKKPTSLSHEPGDWRPVGNAADQQEWHDLKEAQDAPFAVRPRRKHVFRVLYCLASNRGRRRPDPNEDLYAPMVQLAKLAELPQIAEQIEEMKECNTAGAYKKSMVKVGAELVHGEARTVQDFAHSFLSAQVNDGFVPQELFAGNVRLLADPKSRTPIWGFCAVMECIVEWHLERSSSKADIMHIRQGEDDEEPLSPGLSGGYDTLPAIGGGGGDGGDGGDDDDENENGPKPSSMVHNQHFALGKTGSKASLAGSRASLASNSSGGSRRMNKSASAYY